MSNDMTGYESVLADLLDRREKLDAAILAIQAILGVQSPESGVPGGVPPAKGGGMDQQVQSDSFFGMGVYDATVKFLKMMKRKQSTADIAVALERGGLTHSATDFPGTVRTILYRESKKGELVRVGKDWGLKEWYPGMRIKKATQSDTTSNPPAKPKAAKRGKRRAGIKGKPPKAPAPKKPESPEATLILHPGDEE